MPSTAPSPVREQSKPSFWEISGATSCFNASIAARISWVTKLATSGAVWRGSARKEPSNSLSAYPRKFLLNPEVEIGKPDKWRSKLHVLQGPGEHEAGFPLEWLAQHGFFAHQTSKALTGRSFSPLLCPVYAVRRCETRLRCLWQGLNFPLLLTCFHGIYYIMTIFIGTLGKLRESLPQGP